jgi:hypothetical protein
LPASEAATSKLRCCDSGDDMVENTGLNSVDVLATLFDLERKGFVRQLPGKLFSRVLL